MKNIKKILFSIFIFLMFLPGVDAATGSISVSTGTKTAVVGSDFTVTITVSCSEKLGSWQFGITYDSANLSLLDNKSTFIADYASQTTGTKTSYTYRFKAIKAGTASIKISSPSMVSWDHDTELFTPSVSNATVTIKTRQEIEASYSKDNNLKSLSVEGYELSPEFNKETLSYVVSVPDTVDKIKINGQVADSKARVSGTGEKDISEGTNKFDIVVTAQNGAIKTYTITVDRKDLNPIEVTVDGVDYTIVKRADMLTNPTGFTETTLNIEDVEVPGFINEIANLTLVGLKNSEAKIELFIYDKEKNAYYPYNEVKSAQIVLLIKDVGLENIPLGFTREKLDIGDKEFEVLRSDIEEKFYLVYAMNIEDGKEDFYIYDKNENAFLKYNGKIYDNLLNQNKDFKLYMFAAIGFASILILLVIALYFRTRKLKKILRKLKDTSIENSHIKDYEEDTKEKQDDIEEEEEDFLSDKPHKKKSKK